MIGRGTTKYVDGDYAGGTADVLGGGLRVTGALSGASRLEQATKSVPVKATDTFNQIQKNGVPPKGYKGGRAFSNDGRGGGQVLSKTKCYRQH